MLLKHSFLKCYWEMLKIPIYIELRNLNNYKSTFYNYIHELILNNKIKPNTNILERALKSGKFIFILDGFDEINIDKKEQTTQELEDFIDTNNKNYYLFSSRPGTGLESFSRLDAYKVLELSQHEINNFINIQCKILDDEELAKKIIDTINQDAKNSYREYLSNPLLLSMFILTYNDHPELPRSKSKFYFNVFDTLCSRHDSKKKAGYSHSKKTKLLTEDLYKILCAYGYVTVIEEQFNFEKVYIIQKLTAIINKLGYELNISDLLYDLTVSISIIIEDGLVYKFPHRTMQDFFAVMFIKDLEEKSRKIIYEKKINHLLESPKSNGTFFELCSENDRITYYENVLLPTLHTFCNKYEPLTKKDQLLNFVNEFQITYLLEKVVGMTTFSSIQCTYKEKKICYIADLQNSALIRYVMSDEITDDVFQDTTTCEKLLNFNNKTISDEYYSDLIRDNCNKYTFPIYKYSDEERKLLFQILPTFPKRIYAFIAGIIALKNKLLIEIETTRKHNSEIWDF